MLMKKYHTHEAQPLENNEYIEWILLTNEWIENKEKNESKQKEK